MSIDVPHARIEPVVRPDENGSGRPKPSPGIDWQPVVGELLSLAHSWHRETVMSARWTTLSIHVLVGIVMVSVAVLAWRGVIEGQAVAALFGAGAGFLLAKSSNRPLL